MYVYIQSQQVAKLRAARQLWADLVTKNFSPKNKKSAILRYASRIVVPKTSVLCVVGHVSRSINPGPALIAQIPTTNR